MSIHSLRVALTIAATAIGLAATPGLADEPKAEARAAAGRAGVPVSENTKVCVRETLTGSRIPRTFCDTLKNWKAKGIDPLAAN
jgi:hypothetical protein